MKTCYSHFPVVWRKGDNETFYNTILRWHFRVKRDVWVGAEVIRISQCAQMAITGRDGCLGRAEVTRIPQYAQMAFLGRNRFLDRGGVNLQPAVHSEGIFRYKGMSG